MQSRILSSLLPNEIRVALNETIAICSVKHLNALGELIASTPSRTLANFVFWRIVDSYSGPVGIKRKYFNDTRARTQKCFDVVFYYLPLSTNALWIRHFFDRDSKKEVTKILSAIKNEFDSILRTVGWLDEETRRMALEKIRKMKTFVAYPEEFFEDEKLIIFFENLTIVEGNYFETILRLNKFYLYEQFKNVRDHPDKPDWTSFSFVTTVNAFYYRDGNNVSK